MYQDGKIRSIVNYKDNLRHGECIFYREDGTIEKIKNFKDNKPHGKWEVYRENGILKRTQNFKDGRFHGEQKYYDKNGNLWSVDYYENGWKYIVQYIAMSKAVICPASYWTGLANLQKKPVFSWGLNPGQYRFDPDVDYRGIYNFGNNKCTVIPESTNPNIIIKGMEDFLEKRR